MTDEKGTEKHADDEARKDDATRDAGASRARAGAAAGSGNGDNVPGKAAPADAAASPSSDKQARNEGEAGGTSVPHAPGPQDGRPEGPDRASSGKGRKGGGDDMKKAPDANKGGQAGSTKTVATGSGAVPPAARDTGAPGGGSSDDSSNRGGRLATVIAVVAVLIAIIALAWSAWVWQNSANRMAGLDSRVATLQNTVETDVRNMIRPRLDKMHGNIGDLADAVARQGKAVAAMRSQLDTTRLQMADMAQRLQGSARRWRLNQVEHLLITANRRLQLYGSPKQARAALELASKAVSRINDPRLFKVRKQIVDEIAALNALPSPDTEGIALTLSAYIKRVPKLPLASDVPADYQPASGANGGGTKQPGVDLTSGWQHFLDSVGTALKAMVTLRRRNGTQPALLPPDQVYFLTQNLMLELRSARLALLQGNSTLYRSSLETAVRWIKRYFDTSTPEVTAMTSKLEQMQNIKLDWKAPDISASLRALRNYMQARNREQHAADAKAGREQAPAATGNAAGSDAAGQRQGGE